MKKRKMKIRHEKHKFIVGKIFLFLCLFSFSFCFTLRYFTKNMNNETFLRLLLKNGNSHLELKTDTKFFKNLITFITDIDFKKPNTLLEVDSSYLEPQTSSDDDIDIDTIPSSNYIKDPYSNTDSSNPIVYLYNTHQSEEYASNELQTYNVKPTVMMASYILREKLNRNGISTIVEENDVTEFLKTNNWNYASSYKVTKLLMQDAYNKNNSLKYFVDLHRDSVKKSISTVTIHDKKYAKILFIAGLENKDYALNLKMIEALDKSFNEKYPGLSRGIYKKQGKGVNGVYNQDFSPNTILIEIGGQDNTIDEVFNTCEAISEVLTEYIKGDKNEE